jgi:hypothetical protein
MPEGSYCAAPLSSSTGPIPFACAVISALSPSQILVLVLPYYNTHCTSPPYALSFTSPFCMPNPVIDCLPRKAGSIIVKFVGISGCRGRQARGCRAYGKVDYADQADCKAPVGRTLGSCKAYTATIGGQTVYINRGLTSH